MKGGGDMEMRQTNWQLLGLTRFFLSMIVLGTHFSYFTGDRAWWIRLTHDLGGKAAVLGFLFVSGYSIAASLQSAPASFYRRRFLRIYPLYISAVLVTTSVELLTNSYVSAYDRSFEALGFITTMGNVFLLQTFLVKPMAFNTPLWSLSIEVFFYICAPLFVKLSPKFAFGIVLISLGCFMLPQHEDWGSIYYFLSKFNALRYMWAWLLGFMLWFHRSQALAIFSVLCTVVVLFHESTPESLSILTCLISAGAILLASYVPVRCLKWRWVDFLGDISYPLYLFHYPVLIAAYFYGVRGTLALVGIVLCVTLAAFFGIDRYLKGRYLEPWLKRGCRSPQPVS